MNRILVLLCLVSCAMLEIKTMKRFYATERTRSSSEPLKIGHANSEVNNKPTTSTIHNSVTNSHNNKSDEVSPLKKNCKTCSNSTNINNTTTEYSLTSKGKTTETNKTENLVTAASHAIPTYDVGPVFLSDNEDVKSDSRNYYYSWPYVYHTPYEYDNIKYDIEVQKAKDKRFIESKLEKIIPVHEDIDDIPNSYVYTGPNYMYNTDNSDNPIYGNKPFFSYILNGYFDKSYDDNDPFTFKDITWGKEFDKESLYQHMDDYDKQMGYLEDEYPNHFDEKYLETPGESKSDHEKQQNVIKSNKYANMNEFDAINSDSDYQQGYENDKRLYGKYLKEFKDFTDAFANKFGSEAHNKISTYSAKNNADKGQKKNGHRKVSHKDEYQEETKTFDDASKASNSEEHGVSRVGAGGSDAYLRSKATAALGYTGNLNNGAEDIENSYYDTKYLDTKQLSDIDSDLNVYKDVAKNVGFINNDYFDRFMN